LDIHFMDLSVSMNLFSTYTLYWNNWLQCCIYLYWMYFQWILLYRIYMSWIYMFYWSYKHGNVVFHWRNISQYTFTHLLGEYYSIFIPVSSISLITCTLHYFKSKFSTLL
jgi:hypothetical protein